MNLSGYVAHTIRNYRFSSVMKMLWLRVFDRNDTHSIIRFRVIIGFVCRAASLLRHNIASRARVLLGVFYHAFSPIHYLLLCVPVGEVACEACSRRGGIVVNCDINDAKMPTW
jgi:hypothetical protein